MADRYNESVWPGDLDEGNNPQVRVLVCGDCGLVVDGIDAHDAHHSFLDGLASRLAVLDALLTGAVVERRVVGTFDSGVTSHVPIIAPEKEAETFTALQHAGAKDVHAETKVNGRWV